MQLIDLLSETFVPFGRSFQRGPNWARHFADVNSRPARYVGTRTALVVDLLRAQDASKASITPAIVF